MALLTIAGYGDVDVNAPAQESDVVIGDFGRSLSGIARTDVPASGATVQVWGPLASTLPNASADSLLVVLRAGVYAPFDISGDLPGATVSVLASNVSQSKNVDSTTHKTVGYTLSAVEPA